MKIIYFAVICLILNACVQNQVSSLDSPYYKIPIGSVLVLNQPLTIEPNQARIIIQNARVVKRRDVDQYYPYCEFEIRTLSESSQVINPDSFIIQKLDKRMDTSRQQVMYASLASARFDSPLIAYNTVYYLKSDKQPDVLRMSCMYWTDDSMDSYLSQNQITRTLGKIFTIEIKP